MAAAKDGACLAHIADTVSAITAQLEQHREVQQTILATLTELLATSQAQSEMLAEILDAACQEAEPSPIAQALAALAARIQVMDENQANLIALVAELPEAVGRQFEASLKDWSTATDPNP
jgi:vacuolar-type H+-ATPase subunit I/STV1